MFSMLSVLLGSTVASWGLLWFVVPVDWLQTSPTAVLIVHVLPPLLLSLGYYLWQRGKAAREALAARAQEEGEEAERQQLREAARLQHQAALAARQAAADCRWLWVHTHAGEALPDWFREMPEGVYWQTSSSGDEPLSSDWFDYLDTPVTEALATLYRDLPGAACLPLLLQVVPQVSGSEYVQRVKAWQQQAWQQAWPARSLPPVDCRFLSGSGGLADSMVSCLQQDPNLPGVVVLAADAPLLSAAEDEGDTAQQKRAQGEPGAALVLAVILRTDLPVPAGMAWQQGAEADPYQPYWERPAVVVGEAAWGAVPEFDQPAFLQQTLQVRLAQSSQVPLPRKGMLQLTRALHPALDDALVNAGLLDYAFSPDEASPEQNRLHEVAWLVHNSGDLDMGGMRLAAIASNLSRQGIDIQPIDQASNTVREWGDTGVAGSMLLLATAVAQVHRLQAPVVQACFEADQVSVALAYPATSKESA
jgi:hypothetical protein